MTVRGQHIVGVGKNTEASHVEDLGDVAILPGLINVHCHLEFSQLSRPIAWSGDSFVAWIDAVIEWRRSATAADDQYWKKAIQAGLDECLAAGVTCVGDIVTVDSAVGCYEGYPGRAVLFRELLGLTGERAAGLRGTAAQHVTSCPNSERIVAALSPHAPYTTRLDLVREAAVLSRRYRFPVAMHLAESHEELELLHSRSGPLVQLLRERGAWDDQAISAGVSCADFIEALSHADRALLVHGNYLSRGHWQQIAQNSDRMVVVYCPRTHQYFGHPAYRLAEMLAAGVPVAIATDGRSSNPDLNLLQDLRAAARWHPDVDPAAILRAGTVTAAEAVGLGQERGTLRPGKLADMTVVSVEPSGGRDPWSALFAGDCCPHRALLRGVEFELDGAD